MSKLLIAGVVGALAIACAPAQAATLIANYTATTYNGTVDFTLAYDPYDPFIYTFNGPRQKDTPETFAARAGASSVFNQDVRFNVDRVELTGCRFICFTQTFTRLSVGALVAGTKVVGPNDFLMTIWVDNTGRPLIGSTLGFIPFSSYTSSVSGGGSAPFDIVLNSVTSVPEPSSWAMAIIGLGLAGAALRRRPRVRVDGVAAAFS